ncbi:enoyl-CoA hydratase-related protein [Sphingomonas colocasiae]|uniref:Enoyl-CoA hydratase/isomerase family protein n=1 Tax=Sphingomonas colocasiae TaxID=1848973 RepID=A0ABS7PW83_9SPHN|nr:enoyl-CoA hydratase-related protein [Sphingomonas colocasiae]MBY8825620.1 enoyl-CoA hydratase/isomerase family protein [Sphingomonas colocasiae]
MAIDVQADGQEAEVLFERIGDHVVLLTLNRPGAHNAVNGALARQLGEYTMRIEADPSIRVAILAARGKSFCAGVDLKVVAAGRVDELMPFGAGFAGFVYAPRAKPWIAAVHGGAFGGGMELALACDMIVAGENAVFALPEVKRGLIAGAGGCHRIARALPRALAIEMVVTGERLSAERACAFGLANRLVPAGQEITAAVEIAQAIAGNAPSSVRESLRVTRLAADRDETAVLAAQEEAIANVLASPNAREGARAFIEKRAPAWLD